MNEALVIAVMGILIYTAGAVSVNTWRIKRLEGLMNGNGKGKK